MDPLDPMYIGQQGVPLEGGVADGERVSFAFSSAQDAAGNPLQAWLVRTTLYARATSNGPVLQGQQLIGVTFVGNSLIGTHTVRIEGHYLHRPAHGGPALSEYQLTQDGRDYCPNSGHPPHMAMPIAGRWLSDGSHEETDALFSFACSDGVMFKCIDFGYPPWGVRSGTSIAGPPPMNIEGRVLHQACTRMARADYCSNGISHTMNGTYIHYYDIFNRVLGLHGTDLLPYVRYEDPNDRTLDMFLETAWRPGLRSQSAAICLSKKRWSTIPITPEGDLNCPLDPGFKDPRKPDSGANFCDEQTEATLEGQSARLFNDSAFVDLGLYRWSNADDNFTTSAFIDFGVRTQPSDIPPPFQQPAEFEGAVFNYRTRFVPAPVESLIFLCSYSGPSGHWTTTSENSNCFPAPTAYPNLLGLEGRIYRPDTPADALPATAVPLKLFYDPTTGRYITSTGVGSVYPIPTSYYDVGAIGFLPRGAIAP
jgi:hypothetical protein